MYTFITAWTHIHQPHTLFSHSLSLCYLFMSTQCVFIIELEYIFCRCFYTKHQEVERELSGEKSLWIRFRSFGSKSRLHTFRNMKSFEQSFDIGSRTHTLHHIIWIDAFGNDFFISYTEKTGFVTRKIITKKIYSKK